MALIHAKAGWVAALCLSMAAVLVLVLVAPPLAEATISCGRVRSTLAPCIGYLEKGGTPTGRCCSGVAALNNDAKTTPDRQQACKCLQQAAVSMPTIKENFAAALPGKCGLAPETGTVVVIVIVIVTMEVAVVLGVESALSVANQAILPGSAPMEVEGAGTVAGMIGMVEVVVVVVVEGVMVLIGMGIDLEDVTGILVVVGEVTDTTVTVLAHMTAGVLEVSDLGE